MPLRRWSTIELLVVDVARAARFYRGVGLREVAELGTRPEDPTTIILEVPGGGPSVTLRRRGDSDKGGCGVCLAFDVDDVPSLLLGIAGAGGKVESLSWPAPNAVVTHVLDPDGNRLELIERRPISTSSW
jgi:predicted enzyme related to lactoylglutathione lyase